MSRPPLSEKPLAWIDVETTGLDPIRHEVIEFAGIREDTEACLELKIWPSRLEDAELKALEINGYSPEAWEAAGAVSMDEALPQIVAFLQGAILAGQNVSFDEGFLKAAVKRSGLDVRIPYHKLDVVALVMVHLRPLGIRSASLGPVCEVLGVSNEGAHTALVDVLRVRAAYKLLCNPFNDQRAEWARRIETLNAVADTAEAATA